MLRKAASSRFKTKYISALIAIFAVSLLAWGSSARESSPGAQGSAPQRSHPAFTLTASRTITRPEERERLLSIQQRSQRSDGIYKVVQTVYATASVLSTQLSARKAVIPCA